MNTQFFFRFGAPVPASELYMVCVGVQGQSGFLSRAEPCPRCGGQGRSNAWFPDGGICYECRGMRTIQRTHRVYTAERLAKLVAADERKEQKKKDAAEKARQEKRKEFIAWGKSRGVLIGGILTEGDKAPHGFFGSLSDKIRSWGILSERQLGVAERIIAENKKNTAMDDASEHVGDIKERIDFEGIILGVYGAEGYYGHTDIVRIRDLQGNVFTWFASDYTRLDRDQRVSVRGTVKKHDEYKGVKQTVLTRCKINVFETVSIDDATQMKDIS